MSHLFLLPESVSEELSARIKAIAPDVVCVSYTEDGPTPTEAKEATAVLRWVGGNRYAALCTTEGPQVRWLHTASAGVDHVLKSLVREKAEAGNLTLTNSGPAFGIAIGEFVLAWMLSVAHRLPELQAHQQKKRWQSVGQEELHGKTAGIIGLGPIGQGIAERCRALGMRTLGLRRQDKPVTFVDETLTGESGLDRLVRESDWLIIAAALTGETRHLLGKKELAQMKPTARIVNIARGGLIEEPALITALKNGTIAGACLDVFATEPLPSNSPLWTLPNVHIAPHNSSGWTPGLRERQKQLFLDNVARFVKDEPLNGVVDVHRGY